MKYFFPPKNQDYTYLQTNRSDIVGSLWSSFNLDFQTNLGAIRLSQKLVTNTTSSDDGDLGLPIAFEFFNNEWWSICGTRVFKNSSNELTAGFTEDASYYQVGDSTTQFDITNPAGTTFRYTYDTTGTNPGISATTFPIGAIVVIFLTNFNAGNRGTFTITGSGASYFEVTNAGGVAENNKTIGSGSIAVFGGTLGQDYLATESDLKLFNDRLWATSDLALRSKSGDTSNTTSDAWIKRDTLSTGTVHQMVYFKKFDRLYYVNTTSNIRSIDTSDVAVSSGDFTLNPGKSIGFISSMAATTQYIWLGSYRVNNVADSSGSGTAGAITQWDGVSAQVTNEYAITTAGILALVVLDDIPYAFDTEGRILKYAGTSFTEIARLPIDRILLTNATELLVSKFVHFNGFVATKNNTLQVLINNLNEDVGGTVSENLPSGIWELDLGTGNLTHRYSPTLKSRSSSTITDYGQNRISAPGALKINTLQSDSANGRSTLVAGFNYFTDATTVKSGIYIDSPVAPTTDTEGQKRGYFVTTWFNSDEIQDKWTRLWTTFRRFLNSTDKIIFKYRLNEEAPVLATITWTSTTTFTTATDITAYGPTASGFNGTTGGEVEILQGTGSGSCTHISSITGPSGGLYTITLDTAITGVTGTAKARFQKWIKLFPVITGQVNSYAQLAIGGSNIRIQIKGVMEWTGDDEFYKLAIWSNEDIKINA